MDIAKKEIRKAFKEIGYKASFMNNPLTRTTVSLTFWGGGIGKPEHYAGVVTLSYIQEHQAAFDLLRKYDGAVLECSERKIRI